MLRLFGCTSRQKKKTKYHGSLNCNIGNSFAKILSINKPEDFMFAYGYLLRLQEDYPSKTFNIVFNGTFNNNSNQTSVFVGISAFKKELSKYGLYDETLLESKKPLRPSGKSGRRF